MTIRSRKSVVDKAADKLRTLSLASAEGTFLGNEEALVERLGVARNTIRQAARLLEREGMMLVRRGVNGGYFAARPDLGTIERAASAYLASISVKKEDITYISSLLWVEAVRRAARLPQDVAKPMAEEMIQKVDAIAPNAPFAEILELELAFRSILCELTESSYIELIFQINYAFSQGHFPDSAARHGTAEHSRFLTAWRKARLMELTAIMDGDEQLAMMAARHFRNIWHARIWGTPKEKTPAPLGML